MTAVEFYAEKSMELEIRYAKGYIFINELLNELSDLLEKAKKIEKEQKIALLKSIVYSVCIGDDVEDVEEWLKEHELNKSK